MATALFMALTPHAEAATKISLSECNAGGNGPVIEIATSGPFIIEWCEETPVGKRPYTALQNWYFYFGNADPAHVMTMRYECAVDSDRYMMPINVLNNVCF